MNNLKWEHEYIREHKCPWFFTLALAPRHECLPYYINTKILVSLRSISLVI